MSAFANAPPKGSKPKPQPVEEEGPPGLNGYLHSAGRDKPPSPPPPVARVSEKRQKELDAINKMMEEDDEPQGPNSRLVANPLTAELEDFPPDETPAAVSPPQEESQETALSGETPMAATPPSQEPKRKRGKRKVLKKTTKRDEKGYLGLPHPLLVEVEDTDRVVTKNEYVYESFSEDEEDEAVEEKVPKKSVPAHVKSEGEKKKGKGAGAAGQKSLMSFFGKK